MIRARVYMFIDRLVNKVTEANKFRDPNYIKVSQGLGPSRFVHISDYDRVMGPHKED